MSRIDTAIQNLRNNNIEAFYCETKAGVVPLVERLMSEGETVAVGWGLTLFECGIIEHLRCGRYNFIDRYRAGLTQKEQNDIYMDSFTADTYICTSDAVTEDGKIYNSGKCVNRSSAIEYGPKSVIVVVGRNKIAKDIGEALNRSKMINDYKCTLGPVSDNSTRISLANIPRSDYTVTEYQRLKGRIKVIIVGENIL
ncbi:MAG: hypothetical protein BWY15_01438 [Firmicutes bacterium ADurb.Bin193]|nr:MAG: hypothetical protein BWY15_01438 [Firmicutes bacterium ADurb.Bin193]